MEYKLWQCRWWITKAWQMTRCVLKRSDNSGAKTPFGRQKKKTLLLRFSAEKSKRVLRGAAATRGSCDERSVKEAWSRSHFWKTALSHANRTEYWSGVYLPTRKSPSNVIKMMYSRQYLKRLLVIGINWRKIVPEIDISNFTIWLSWCLKTSFLSS